MHLPARIQKWPGIRHNTESMLNFDPDTCHSLVPPLFLLCPHSWTRKWTDYLMADSVSWIPEELEKPFLCWSVLICAISDSMLCTHFQKATLVKQETVSPAGLPWSK
jgi:hypothetical protein